MGRLTTALTANAGNGHSSRNGTAASAALPVGALRHLASALKKQWRRYRKALRCCQENFSAAAVHDSRVETRRLLALVGLLSPFLSRGRAHKMQALLKRHLDSFDQLRDTQVQLSAVSVMKPTFAAAGRFCQYLRKREKHFALRTRREVKKIRSRRLGKLAVGCRDNLKNWEQKDLHYAANALLLRRVHAAFARTQRLRDQIDSQDTKTIHRTRIAFKKFRYIVELLAEDLPQVDKTLLRAIHHYQTMMGDIQDAQVLLTAFEEFLRKKKIEPQAARAFREHLLQRRKALVEAYLGVAELLPKFWPTPAASPRQAQQAVIPTRSNEREPEAPAHSRSKKKSL